MSTTVSYKGSTLTTVTNQTKHLLTAGKYMEDNITITDESSGGSAIVVTEETDEGGGIIKYITAVDLSNDTVAPGVLLAGYTAHDHTGNPIVGTASGGGGNYQDQTVTPSETQQTVTPETGYDALSSVTVNAISSTYVGSGITRRSSTDLTASGATVTVPAGYYSVQATKSVTTMTLPTSASSTSSGTSKATISRSTSAQYINIPAGYNSTAAYYTISAVANMTLPTSASSTSSGTSKATISRSTSAQYINIPVGYNDTASYYTISATPNGSATGPTSLSGTSATISTGTNTITLTKTGVTTTPTVSAGYVSSATASTATVTLTASVTTKAAATITPGTTNQTIAAGTYLTGVQTISGDADLVGSNIISTANIFGVQGTVVIQNVYTGSSAPSSSTGSNGDIYIQA